MRLDPLDAAIVRLLQEDARLSFREIAARLGSTTPTVSARVKTLEAIGLVRGYHADVEPSALPGDLVLLTVRLKRASEAVAAALRASEGVEDVLLLEGDRVQARVRGDAAPLVRALERMPDVAGVEAARVVAHAWSAAPRLEGVDVNVACHLCRGPIAGDPVRATVGDRPHVFCCRHCATTFKERHDRFADEARPKVGRR